MLMLVLTVQIVAFSFRPCIEIYQAPHGNACVGIEALLPEAPAQMSGLIYVEQLMVMYRHWRFPT